MNRRILLLLGFVLLIFAAVAGGIGVYLLMDSAGSKAPVPASKGNGTSSVSLTPVGNTPIAIKGCGIAKTSTGYSYSWLHVSHGYMMDDKNCIVNLKGFNWSQLEFGNAVGGGKNTRITEQGIAWFNQTFHMNVWRIPVNAIWWNENVYVPLAGMHYQDWIQQAVRWAEKYGDYVILTKGPQFHNPPCGGSVKMCSSQNQGKKNYTDGTASPQELTTGQYIDPAVAMWTSLARLYANDPAVLYDSWNEMHNIDAQTWQQSENTLIETIRAQNPQSLIFLGGPNYKGDINPLIRGSVSDFTQSNLVYDFHVYNGYKGSYQGKNCDEPLSYVWQDWSAHADEQVGFSQQHGKAVAFSEWGGCNNFDEYNRAITSYARSHHISLVYYDETNVSTWVNGTYELTENGAKVQAAYATF